jgi:small redox-active disulfide protein 2
MHIKILGTGCPNCKKLEANTRQVLEELKIEAEVEKITDIAEIMRYGVMSLPALVIDGEVKLSGRIPDEEELRNLFSK